MSFRDPVLNGSMCAMQYEDLVDFTFCCYMQSSSVYRKLTIYMISKLDCCMDIVYRLALCTEYDVCKKWICFCPQVTRCGGIYSDGSDRKCCAQSTICFIKLHILFSTGSDRQIPCRKQS